MRKIGSRAKQLFNSLALLLLTFSCTKELVRSDIANSPIPLRIEHTSTIEIEVPQFTPQKIAVDITGRIFVTGNNRRLIYIEGKAEFEEITLESIYPCEIVDIDTDGFDIFLLDRLNRTIWTIKQKNLLEQGFPVEGRPLRLGISERNYMAIIFGDRKELSIFQKGEKLFTGIHLTVALRENERSDLLFSENILYVAESEENRLEVLPLFDPSQRHQITVPAPTSLAMDAKGYPFIACEGQIGFLLGNVFQSLQSLPQGEVEIAIHNDTLFAMNALTGRIDVYKIVYAAPGTDTP